MFFSWREGAKQKNSREQSCRREAKIWIDFQKNRIDKNSAGTCEEIQPDGQFEVKNEEELQEKKCCDSK